MTAAKFTPLNTLVNKALNEYAWIDTDYFVEIGTDNCIHTLRAIAENGCASGAYMPAVEYYTAKQTMAEHGDDIIRFITAIAGLSPTDIFSSDMLDCPTWSQICVAYVSMAVELLAQEVLDEAYELDYRT